MVTKHFCDGCGVEVRGRWVRMSVRSRHFSDEASPYKYDLCDGCYAKVRAIIATLPENAKGDSA
jgi:NMD protein affecting ribosome stability and mRNA decay